MASEQREEGGALVRFGVSIESDLLAGFDLFIGRKGYANRSEAIRALIRDAMLQERLETGTRGDVVGAVSLVYDHGSGDISGRLIEIQHRFHEAIVSTLHVHIDAHRCLELLVVRGKSDDIRRIADSIIGTRGVLHGRLLIAGEPEPR